MRFEGNRGGVGPHRSPSVTNEGMNRELPAWSEDIDSPDLVDITLIRWMLSLTPEERLRVLQERPSVLRDFSSLRPRDRYQAELRLYRLTLEERRKQGG